MYFYSSPAHVYACTYATVLVEDSTIARARAMVAGKSTLTVASGNYVV
jgi:hypothetical protein